MMKATPYSLMQQEKYQKFVSVRGFWPKCCQELAVWVGEKFERAAYMKPVSRQVTSVCTPRVCSIYSSPWFNIGSEEEDAWVKVENKEIIMAKKPKEIELDSHNKEEEFIMSEPIYLMMKAKKSSVFSV